MLPPLRSSSGSGSSFQNHSTLSTANQRAAQAAYKVPFVDLNGDSNSSSAGKLNVLLLAGRERIADHLAMLADAVGRAIDMPRREGESNMNYILRLAEAVTRLGPRQRADVERQLNLVVQGLKLRVLFEAFSNPAGPEAARIVAYLETARYKDRDLAARSVVTSYRQNDGPETGAGETASGSSSHAPQGRSAPSSPSGSTAAQNGQKQAAPSSQQSPMPVPNSYAEHLDQPVAPVAMGPAAEDEAMPAPRRMEEAAQTLPETDAGTEGGSDMTDQSDGIDARSLQALLRRAFDSGESGDAAIEAKATAELLAVEGDPATADLPQDDDLSFDDLAEFETGDDQSEGSRKEPASSRRASGEQDATPLRRGSLGRTHNDGILARHRLEMSSRQTAPDHTAPEPETAQPERRPLGPAQRLTVFGGNPLPKEDVHPTLYALKGWTETEIETKDIVMAYEAIVEDGEEAQSLLRPADPPRQTAATARHPQATDADAGQDHAPARAEDSDPIYDPRSATGRAVKEQDTPLPARSATAAEQAAAKQQTETAQVRAQSPAALEQQALAQLLPTGKDAMPVALAPVALRADSVEEEPELEGRPFGRDGKEEDGAAEDEAEHRDEEAQAATGDAGEPAAQDEIDIAYDLYQRMANWA